MEDWGKFIGDVPSATAILDRFLHHAEIIAINGKSYRLRNQKTPTGDGDSKPANLPTGSAARRKSKSALIPQPPTPKPLANRNTFNDYPTSYPGWSNLPMRGWI